MASAFSIMSPHTVMYHMDLKSLLCSLIESVEGEGFEGRPHDLEVTRLQVALDVVERDAEEESKINAQLAQLVCMRLEASRRAVERMLGVLQVDVFVLAACYRICGSLACSGIMSLHSRDRIAETVCLQM